MISTHSWIRWLGFFFEFFLALIFGLLLKVHISEITLTCMGRRFNLGRGALPVGSYPFLSPLKVECMIVHAKVAITNGKKSTNQVVRTQNKVQTWETCFCLR